MREINEHDLEMYTTMNKLRHLSRCLDKQVVCLIVDEEYNILSIGINTVEACDQNCDDKEKRLCVVKHAEVVAIENLSVIGRQRARRAYVSLFPCAPCQACIEPYVDEIVTFGMAHKKWESDKITVFPHLSYKLEGRGASFEEIENSVSMFGEPAYSVIKEITDDLRVARLHALDKKYHESVRSVRKSIYFPLLEKYAGRVTGKTLQDNKIGDN